MENDKQYKDNIEKIKKQHNQHDAILHFIHNLEENSKDILLFEYIKNETMEETNEKKK